MCREDESVPVLVGSIKVYVGVEVQLRTFLTEESGSFTFGPLALEINPVPTGYEAGLTPKP
jgi:hypothetical protein